MTVAFRRIAAGLALAAATAAHASTSLTTDYSDLWYNRTESGWGVNMIQQADIVFATFFVYGTAGQPTWYVASATALLNPSAALPSFSGPLYQTLGPYFAGTFDPAAVSVRQVGTFTFFATSANAGSIAYSVDGVEVFKDVERQTWRVENLAGTYPGAATGAASDCPSGNGRVEAAETWTVTQSGSDITVAQATGGRTCTFQGGYEQAGRMGTILAAGPCSDGATRTLEASELQVGRSFLTGKYVLRSGACRVEATFAGPRRP